MDTIRIARLRPEALLPNRKHPTDAGLDLYAAEALAVLPHGFGVARTGITLEILPGWVGLIKPKSRSNFLVGAGVVDAGYQGEVLVKLANLSDTPLEIAAGDAVAQLLILPVSTPAVVEESAEAIHAETSSRGATGGIVGKDEG